MTHGWHEIGKYRVCAKPIFDNPAFTTHHIFLNGALIGRQLTPPSITDCDWYASRNGQYAKPEESHVPQSYRLRGQIKSRHDAKIGRLKRNKAE